MKLTQEQREWVAKEMRRLTIERCWCIVHDPETDTHNRLPRAVS